MSLRPAPSPESHDPRLEARACAAYLRLALGRQTWSGQQGNWAGAGTGSSIDFQDHRPYMPGDDPRYIDWAAYARSGQTIMKLYREEVSPRLDLILDTSPSMGFDPDKAQQILRLFFFCVESALELGAALQVFQLAGEKVALVPSEEWRAPDWRPPVSEPEEASLRLDRVPFRSGSLRVVLTDLLFPSPPEDALRLLTGGRGRGMLLVPYCRAESDPDWRGNMELIDCEGGDRRRQRVDDKLRRSYRTAYDRHMDGWRESCRRYAVAMARIPAEPSLSEALEAEALSMGVVETWV